MCGLRVSDPRHAHPAVAGAADEVAAAVASQADAPGAGGGAGQVAAL